MTSKQLHEMIDACRPGHHDVDQPELAELARALSHDPNAQRLFERSQELDATIRSTFQAVTPPPGLAERLLAALETPPMESDEVSSAAGQAESRVELAQPASRRSVALWAGIASLAAVAAVVFLWFQWPQPVSSLSDRDIAEIVDGWNADLEQTDWQTTANIPADEFPTWQHLDLRDVAGWQWVKKRQIACYDFAVSGGQVRLFVMKPDAPAAFPTAPPIGYPSPNGWHVGAWQANGRVYYLAVVADGDSKGLYSRVINSPFSAA